jgi:anti-anti-sigma factor
MCRSHSPSSEIIEQGDVTVVRLRGPKLGLDARESLYELVDVRGVRKLILDFQAVHVLTSSPIGMLVSLRKKMETLGGSVAFCHVSTDVREILRLTAVAGLFAVFDMEQDAIQSFRQI